jgi:p-aminobenzoyl-glutamate transporter AbgT
MIGVQVKSSPLKWLFTILIYFALILFMLFVTGKIVGPDNWATWPNN